MSHWLNWNEINQKLSGKKVLLYGRAEDWVPKTLKKIAVKPDYIVDRASHYHNTTYKDLPVVPPSVLEQEDKSQCFIIITTGSYESVTPYLQQLGFIAGQHYCCCPDYYDLSILDSIRSYDRTLVLSSSDYNDTARARSSKGGGGLFKYNTFSMEKEPLVKGSFRQIVRDDKKNCYFAIEYVEQKLYIFDNNFHTLEKIPLDAPNYCGVALSDTTNTIAAVNSSQDSITFFDRDSLQQTDRVFYSHKANGGYESHHHLNDLCIQGDSLFVSYFSHSGNWHKSIYDGGVSEYSLSNLSKGPTQIMYDLWNPHSPQMIDGDLAILDSMRGQLWIGNQKVEGEFDGFARGLATDGRYLFIGQSESMYMSRLAGIKKNLMLNAGFYLFDVERKLSRFFSLPDHMNVHDIMVLDN